MVFSYPCFSYFPLSSKGLKKFSFVHFTLYEYRLYWLLHISRVHNGYIDDGDCLLVETLKVLSELVLVKWNYIAMHSSIVVIAMVAGTFYDSWLPWILRTCFFFWNRFKKPRLGNFEEVEWLKMIQFFSNV